MTLEQSTRAAPALQAALARSVLGCPAELRLDVDGVDAPAAPEDGLPDADGPLLQDVDGRPVLSCDPGSPIAAAAVEGRAARLDVVSGLGRAGSPERSLRLSLTGTLAAEGLEDCGCCDRVRTRVALRLTEVVLDHGTGRPAVPVPVDAFTSREHVLNRGFLQRSAEHANACHQDELRRAVATLTGDRPAAVGGVQLTGLRPDGVEVQWVDAEGAHSRVLAFRRAATTAAELGELLRQELHAGLC